MPDSHYATWLDQIFVMPLKKNNVEEIADRVKLIESRHTLKKPSDTEQGYVDAVIYGICSAFQMGRE